VEGNEVETLGAVNVLSVQIEEDLVYRPKSRETRVVYEQMLNLVQRHMGDHSLETIKGALDEVLAILKSEGVSDAERKQEIEGLIDKLSETEFNSLTVLGQALADYVPENADARTGGEAGKGGEEVDELAVDPEMDYSGSESSDFEDVYNVKDVQDSGFATEQAKGEEEGKDHDQKEDVKDSLAEPENAQTVIQAASEKQGSRSKAQPSHLVDLHQVDAQWLNRNLTKFLD